MIDPVQLEIRSYDGKPLVNQFWAADNPNGWLAVILPGLGYTSDMPLMFFTRRLLQWREVEVLNLNPATRSEEFQNSSHEVQLAWLKSDVLSGLNKGLTQNRYQGIFLVGKSIGSLGIAQAAADAQTLLPTAIIWLTPLLRYSVVVEAALKAEGPQAHICGGADPTYIPEVLNRILAQKSLSKVFVTPRANHILEVPGDEHQTFIGIGEAMLFMANFMDGVLSGSLYRA